jgi:hypothetical protein
MAIAKEIISSFEGEIIIRNRHPTGLEQIVLFKNVVADLRLARVPVASWFDPHI